MCGSDRIEFKRWVTVNTKKVGCDAEEDWWCPDCEEHFHPRNTVELEKNIEYKITYEIEVTADSPIEAARFAYAMMVDKSSMLPVFKVAPERVVNADEYEDPFTVDLDIVGLNDEKPIGDE
jgi:hypothetical protein